ncbi:MAG: hypothetical protein IJJ99_03275 [Oscillospiraceae bacterium]|nr:hypothetical protein [Oscillospiraceae bacterium]
MIANFKKTVDSKGKANPIAKEILNAYNSQLPETADVEYVNIGDGACALVPRKRLPQMAVSFNIPAATLSESLPDDIKTKEDLLDYIYRTQRSISFDTEGCQITINGYSIDISDMVKFPTTSVSFKKKGSITIEPPAFPPCNPLVIETSVQTLFLNQHRIPDERKDVVVLESTDESWISFKLEVNNSKGMLSGKFNINCSKCENLQEYITVLKILNELADGRGSIYGEKVKVHFNAPRIDDRFINFLERVRQLEDCLQVKFTSFLTISLQEYVTLVKLIRCLLDKKPFREKVNSGPSVGFHFEDSTIAEKLRGKELGRDVAFTFTQSKCEKVLGAQISFYQFSCLFDAKLSDAVIEDQSEASSVFVNILPADDTEYFIMSSMIFKNEHEFEAYQKNHSPSPAFFNSFLNADDLSI